MKSLYKKKSFTLAEVLITLALIGVIASMTVPSLQNNINDSQHKVMYKAAIADANAALKKAYVENTLVPRSSWFDTVNNQANFIAIKNQFQVTKDCTTNTGECWDMNGEKLGHNPIKNTTPAFIDAKGRAWVREDSSGTNGGLFLDTNGFRGPNIYGKDRFRLATVVKSTGKGNDIQITGIPTTIMIDRDYPDPEPNFCPSGKCYYRAWLIN